MTQFWTEDRIRNLLSSELYAIVKSTRTDGRYAEQIAWAKDELWRRARLPCRAA